MNMNSKNKIIFYILLIITLVIIIYLIVYKYKLIDSFDSIPQTTKQNYNDGTQLYCSLFLDNLNEVVINMTNPPIKYDTKTIELIKYSDILL